MENAKRKIDAVAFRKRDVFFNVAGFPVWGYFSRTVKPAKGHNFIFIKGFSVRVFLLFPVFLLQLFYQLATAKTPCGGFVPVLAVLGVLGFMGVITGNNENSAECLYNKSC